MKMKFVITYWYLT